MPDFNINEGNLTFKFKDVDFAEKYDNWSHYRNQFQKVCQGSKAVDILCIVNRTCWLIEIKDYRQHPRTKSVDLPSEISIKVRDTIAGLVSAKMYASDHSEKSLARRALACDTIKVAVHLEQPETNSKLRPRIIDPANLKKKLQQQMKALDAHPNIFDCATIPNQLNLTVITNTIR